MYCLLLFTGCYSVFFCVCVLSKELAQKKRKKSIVRNGLWATTTKKRRRGKKMKSLQKQIKYCTACQQSIIKFRFTTKARSQSFPRESRISNKMNKSEEKKKSLQNLTLSLAWASCVCFFCASLSCAHTRVFWSVCEYADALDFYLPKIKFENRLNDGGWEIKKKKKMNQEQ